MVSFKFTSFIVLATAFVARVACVAVDVAPSQLVSSYDKRGTDDLLQVLPDLRNLMIKLQQFDNAILKLGEDGNNPGSGAATAFNQRFDAVIQHIKTATFDTYGILPGSLPSGLFAELPLRENLDTAHKVIDDFVKEKSIIMADPSIAPGVEAKIRKLKESAGTYLDRLVLITKSPADKETLVKYIEELDEDFERL